MVTKIILKVSNLRFVGETLSYVELYIGGASAGIICSVFSSPIELIKTQLQVQSDARKLYTGPIDCVRKIAATRGVKGLYRGYSPTLLREFQAYGFYYMAYAFFRYHLTPEGSVFRV